MSAVLVDHAAFSAPPRPGRSRRMTRVWEFVAASELASDQVRSVLPLSATVMHQSYGKSADKKEARLSRLLSMLCSSFNTGIVMSTLKRVMRIHPRSGIMALPPRTSANHAVGLLRRLHPLVAML